MPFGNTVLKGVFYIWYHKTLPEINFFFLVRNLVSYQKFWNIYR